MSTHQPNPSHHGFRRYLPPTIAVLAIALASLITWQLLMYHNAGPALTSAPKETAASDPNCAANLALASAIKATAASDPNWRLAPLVQERVRPNADHSLMNTITSVRQLVDSDAPSLPRAGETTMNIASIQLNEHLPNHIIKALENNLSKYEPALVQLQRAASQKTEPFAWDTSSGSITLIKLTVPHMWTLSALHLKCLIAIERQPATTPSLLASMITISQQLTDPPCFVTMTNRLEFVSAITEDMQRLLGNGAVQDAELADLQRLIEAEDNQATWLTACRYERAAYFEHVLEGDSITPHPNPAELLSLMNHLVDIARLPIERQTPYVISWQETMPPGEKIDGLHLRHAIDAMKLFQQYTAHLRCAYLALAIERFRYRNGRWPVSQEEMVKKSFLSAIIVDPVKGRPIVIVKRDSGRTIECPTTWENSEGVSPTAKGQLNTIRFELFDVSERGLGPR